MTSVSTAIPLYLDSVKLARSHNTYKTYKSALRAFERIVGPEAELDEENYKKFLKVTAEENDRAQITQRVPVSRLYKRYAPGVPIDLLTEDYGRKHSKRHITYNEDGIGKLVSYAQGLRGDIEAWRDRAFILTLYETGLRISEACNLDRGTIDFEKGRALIVGKGDKPGVVRFGDRSLQAIRDYLQARAELDGKTGRPLSSLPVFARHDRGAGKKLKRVGVRGMSVAFTARKREAGISEEDELEAGIVTPHKLRHRFVTEILRETGNPAIAQALARHEDINTTMRYGHLTETSLDEAYRSVFNRKESK